MKYDLKNLGAIPYDVSTLSGPDILPANGTLKGVELDALQLEVVRHSFDIEVAEAKDKPASQEKGDAEEDLKTLRDDYFRLSGKKPSEAWKAARLAKEIEKFEG